MGYKVYLVIYVCSAYNFIMMIVQYRTYVNLYTSYTIQLCAINI